MNYTLETAIVALGAFLALLGAAFAHDSLFAAHMWVLFFTLLVSTVLLLRRVSFAPVDSAARARLKSEYFDEVVKYGVIATVFWGSSVFWSASWWRFSSPFPILISRPISISAGCGRCTHRR